MHTRTHARARIENLRKIAKGKKKESRLFTWLCEKLGVKEIEKSEKVLENQGKSKKNRQKLKKTKNF